MTRRVKFRFLRAAAALSGLALAWVCVLAGPALAAPAAEGNASGRAPVADGVARRALEEALRFADVIYQWEGRAEQGVAYLWGGRMSVDEYLQAVAEGKRPGVEAGVDASGLVVQAYRAADPAIRFVVESGGGEQRVRDVSSGALYRWNVRTVPVDELRPGDLIFFQNSSGQVSGVAIFERREGPNVHFVVASANSGKVIRTFLNVNNEYWKTRVLGAGQLLEASP